MQHSNDQLQLQGYPNIAHAGYIENTTMRYLCNPNPNPDTDGPIGVSDLAASHPRDPHLCTIAHSHASNSSHSHYPIADRTTTPIPTTLLIKHTPW
jgi:hypothetical protein